MTEIAFRGEIQRLVEAFIGDVTALARKAARSQLTDAFLRATNQPAHDEPVLVADDGKRHRHVRKGRRSTRALENMMVRILECLQTHDGMRAEEIRRALNVPFRTIGYPLRKLVGKRCITKVGDKRGARYYVVGKVVAEVVTPSEPTDQVGHL
jgi:hypothetical protein